MNVPGNERVGRQPLGEGVLAGRPKGHPIAVSHATELGFQLNLE